jgi:hypothetical protein
VEGAFRSPLLDFFRRGEVPLEVRRLAARGLLAPRAQEQLALLMLLVSDPDPDVAAASESTLQSIPTGSLAAFLARSDVPSEMRSFFAARGVVPAALPAPAENDAPFVDRAPERPVQAAAAETPAADDESQSTVQRLGAMNVAQKIGVAMKGTREERAVLIRDPNKLVAVAVLSSPKMTEPEVESIAKMATLSDEILRIIANNRAWMKRYGIMLALTRNPKTPVGISMNLLGRLTERDLRFISSDRNVPEVLRITARQKIVLNK